MPTCPISCGDCCDQWANVDILWDRNHRRRGRDDLCPHLGSDGCLLSRSRRPKVCLDFLCDRALKVSLKANS
jgi:hypothetical protein